MANGNTANDDTANLYVRGIDPELKDFLDSRQGTLGENVNTLLWQGLGGDGKQSALQNELDRSRERSADIRAKISRLETRLSLEEDRAEEIQQMMADSDSE